MFDLQAINRVVNALADHNCRAITFRDDGSVTVAIETWGTVSRYTYSTAEIAVRCIREARVQRADDSKQSEGPT